MRMEIGVRVWYAARTGGTPNAQRLVAGSSLEKSGPATLCLPRCFERRQQACSERAGTHVQEVVIIRVWAVGQRLLLGLKWRIRADLLSETNRSVV